ncbi:peptide/nickel transport system ATP-binding protein [Bacillus tianshenii]|uniref:Peptide/nickel transport system ATP-binding protein n=2 Tax=Sutcliffiella tianshenii TaxID=1463404 RepID=A0ABS2NV49_9BACI|nr:peptide/nickel transport system ATP-binding protein [Bacillus tianshenii]
MEMVKPVGGPILEVKNLTISAPSLKKELIKSMDLAIQPGKMLGLIGESGSGKSLTAAAILGLLPPTLQVTGGKITFMDLEITALPENKARALRGRDIAYLSQNYQGFFTPFIKIGEQLVEVIQSHGRMKKSEAKEKSLYWLDKVSLPAQRVYDSYPYQLSGGMLQRASIASAIMFRPKLIIADEPSTALDVLTGERILDLLVELQQELNCSVLLISHDLNHIINRTEEMAVMYGGQIVEQGSTAEVHRNPVHPYTQMLLQSRLKLSRNIPDRLPAMEGEAAWVEKSGCPFAPRCKWASAQCHEIPPMSKINGSHLVACHAVSAERMKAYARS